uniref:Uncharacterized protein n=1 Tax=Fibrocapsa japonica TaxID=94617 RepID=A0A7S2V5E0_9STRA
MNYYKLFLVGIAFIGAQGFLSAPNKGISVKSVQQSVSTRFVGMRRNSHGDNRHDERPNQVKVQNNMFKRIMSKASKIGTASACFAATLAGMATGASAIDTKFSTEKQMDVFDSYAHERQMDIRLRDYIVTDKPRWWIEEVQAPAPAPIPVLVESKEIPKGLIVGVGAAALLAVAATRKKEEPLPVVNLSEPALAVVQVALKCDSRSNIQDYMKRLYSNVDPSKQSSLGAAIRSLASELTARQNSWVSGTGYIQRFNSLKECEIAFNQQALEERVKWDREYYDTGKEVDEYAVITLLVASQQVGFELPLVSNKADLLNALDLLSSASTLEGGKFLLGVEVLWTPQDADDYLTLEDVYSRWPHLVEV